MLEYNFNARGYELDSYGHVNHAVYLNYFEQARWELFRQRDLTVSTSGREYVEFSFNTSHFESYRAATS